MSLNFQMISVGKGQNAKTASFPGNTDTAGSAGKMANGLFSQTLIQSMTGGLAQEQATVSSSDTSAVTLQSLLKSGITGNSGEDDKTPDFSGEELLNELLPELAKLDEQIESDPALLAALQGWLLQVSALKQGADAVAEGQNQNELTPLAQNPATARFAVQDELSNLAALIQQAAKGGDKASADKALALLNSFAAIVEPYMGTAGSSVGKTAAQAISFGTTDTDKLQGPLSVKTGGHAAGTMMSETGEAAANKSDASGQSAAASANVKAVPGGTQELKMALETTEVKVEHSEANSGETVTEQDASQGDGKIMTAGQFSLRDGITTHPKTEIPQVPVQKFAQEMTGFITGKLEIVKKGGIAEATLSLFPENLGQVDVKITMQNGHLVAQFATEHAAAKDMLENQMSQLRAALQSQGLQVEKLEVSQNGSSPQSQLFHDGRQSGAGGRESDRRSKERKESAEDAVLAAEFEGDWREWQANERQNARSVAGQFSAEA